MSHSSAKRWPKVEQEVEKIAAELVGVLGRANEVFEQFQEMSTFAGGTDQLLADQLYLDINKDPITGDPNPATAEQVAIVADAKNAMIAANDLYKAAFGDAFVVGDRLILMRRMI